MGVMEFLSTHRLESVRVLGNAAQTGIQVNDTRRFHETWLGQLELPTGSRVGVHSVKTAVDSRNSHGDQFLG